MIFVLSIRNGSAEEDKAGSSPGFSLRLDRQKLKWRNPGILAYEIGTFDLTLGNEVGKSTPRRGKYVVVWKKQANGMWKSAADIFNTDQ